jgi:hypothetical protein
MVEKYLLSLSLNFDLKTIYIFNVMNQGEKSCGKGIARRFRRCYHIHTTWRQAADSHKR